MQRMDISLVKKIKNNEDKVEIKFFAFDAFFC